MNKKKIIALVEEKAAYSKVTASLAHLRGYLLTIKKYSHKSPDVQKIGKLHDYYMKKRLAIDKKLEAE